MNNIHTHHNCTLDLCIDKKFFRLDIILKINNMNKVFDNSCKLINSHKFYKYFLFTILYIFNNRKIIFVLNKKFNPSIRFIYNQLVWLI